MPWRKMRFFDKSWVNGDLDDDKFEKRIEDYGSYIRSFYGELKMLERIFVDLNFSDAKIVSFAFMKSGARVKFYIGDLQNGYCELSVIFKNFHIDDSALGEIIASEVAFAEKKFYFSYMMDDLNERHFVFDEICNIKFKKISSKIYSNC
ncbi:hypothetical protein G5B96_01145 [Campylobacter concisus]|uniref:Uncharacterized protein n=2 Tax=Campylobacter concisus TaxID=199 RepID=A0A7S9S9N2_9BACT|nr:hypothetical protein ATCC51561_1378 [Campylobacter concisus ATCC 51561]QPI06003.1 hypothetical protein G5B96_01145 [Campylobacter concisus]